MNRSTVRLVLGLLGLMLLGTAIFGWFTYHMILSRRHVVAGNAALDKGDRAAARAEFEAALAEAGHVPGHGGIIAEPHVCLGRVDEQEGRLAEAEAHFQAALDAYDAMTVGGAFGAGAVATAVGRVRLARGDAKGAVESYEAALRRLEPWKEDADKDVQAALLGLAEALDRRGSAADAAAVRARAGRARLRAPALAAPTPTTLPDPAPAAPAPPAAAPAAPAPPAAAPTSTPSPASAR